MATQKETTQNSLENMVNELAIKVARSSVAVIDTMVQRGAIKGEELSVMGNLRDQSVKLIQLVEGALSEKA